MQPSLLAQLQKLSADACTERCYFDRFSPEAVYIRLLALYCALQEYYTYERPEERAGLLRELNSICALDSNITKTDPIGSFLLAQMNELTARQPDTPLRRTGWEAEPISELVKTIPGMLCPETMKYYQWLGRTIAGRGEIVELGCWMGCSTACIASGWRNNPRRNGRSIHVFDAFTWMGWMDHYNSDENLRQLGLRVGDSFLDLFWKYCGENRDLIDVHRAAVRAGGLTLDLPELRWPKKEVALLIVDIADDIDTTRAVWEVFSPSFVSSESVIVFNQFGNVGALDLRKFCREHSAELEPIHKPAGSPKTFRYHNTASQHRSSTGKTRVSSAFGQDA